MARKHHKPEEIIAKLRQVEVLVGQGKPVADAVKAIDWNGKPIAVRARNSKSRISQRRSIMTETLPGLFST